MMFTGQAVITVFFERREGGGGGGGLPTYSGSIDFDKLNHPHPHPLLLSRVHNLNFRPVLVHYDLILWLGVEVPFE